jgi:hypothetical protein
MKLARWIVALAILSSLARVPISLARYTDSAVTAASFTADILNPPTGLAASGALSTTATLTWTITPDAYATGYNVYRSTTSGSGFSLIKSVTPRTATTTTDSPLVPGTYYYVLRSSAASWLSAASNQVSVVLL